MQKSFLFQTKIRNIAEILILQMPIWNLICCFKLLHVHELVLASMESFLVHQLACGPDADVVDSTLWSMRLGKLAWNPIGQQLFILQPENPKQCKNFCMQKSFLFQNKIRNIAEILILQMPIWTLICCLNPLHVHELVLASMGSFLVHQLACGPDADVVGFKPSVQCAWGNWLEI